MIHLPRRPIMRLIAPASVVLGFAWPVLAQNTPAQQPAHPPELAPPLVDEPAKDGQPQKKLELDKLLDLLQLLQEDSVREELKLEPGQSPRLEGLAKVLRDPQGGGLLQKLAALGLGADKTPEDGIPEAPAEHAEAGDAMQEFLGPMLEEEQVRRLKEILLQLRMRRRGAPSALSNDELARALDLTKDQQEELRKRGEVAAEQTREQMQAKLSELKSTVKDVLTPEQSDKLDLLLGEEFDLPAAMLEPGETAVPPHHDRPRLLRRRGGLLRPREESPQ